MMRLYMTYEAIYPILEVATFCLWRWYVLDVLLLLVLTWRGHEHQDPCCSSDGMQINYTQTGPLCILSSKQVRLSAGNK